MSLIDSPYQFGIDFSAVPAIPEDRKARQPYLNSFRALLKEEREKIKLWHRAGAGGREVVQAHTGLIDELIKRVVRSLADLPPYSGGSALENFALAAVGGYGRGELNPHSDIDLLFILKNHVDDSTNPFIQDFISILWGIDLDVGHGCRRPMDCLNLAKEDFTVQTAMIDMRLLIGNQLLFEELNQSLGKDVLTKNMEKFLSGKLEENQARRSSIGDVVCNVEPNIKNGPGGLRDYHTALWGVASRFGSLSFLETDDGTVSEKELRSFNRSVDFFLRVRNELHYLSDKKTDVLKLEIQSDLAANLGYGTDNAVSSAQQFMREYFLHATNIYNFSEVIYKRCLQKGQPYFKKVIAHLQKKDLGNGFYDLKSVLHFEGDAGEAFAQNKGLLLDLFDLCRERGLELDPQLKRQIRLHRRLLDEEFLKGSKAPAFFSALLDRPNSEKTLRLMHEVGILGQILPEFGHTYCLVKYDFYHRYTADEHALRMVRFLERLDDAAEEDLLELSRIYSALPRRGPLKLAALLHSLGSDPRQSARQPHKYLLSTAAARLKLEEDEQDTLAFLLENLHEMTEIAFHQEIQHLSTIQDFARKVGSLQRLDLLYLTSYAELKAVAPETWTSWKRFLLSELYRYTKDYLQQPESFHKQSSSTRLEVCKTLYKDFFMWELQTHLDMMDDDYWMSTPPATVALHIRLLRALGDKPFALQTDFNASGGYHNLTLCYRRDDDSFKPLVGILTAKNMNILGAQIFLRPDRVVISTLQVEQPARGEGETDTVWKEAGEDLQDILENRKQIRDLLASRKRYVTPKTRSDGVIPKIQIDNVSNPAYTVLRVEARDHLGMLYKIVTALADFGVQIHRAKISCRGSRGIDVFYVSLRGAKIVFKRLIRQIKERLINVLLIENVEDVV